MRIVENTNLTYPSVCTLCERDPYGATVVDVERYTPEHPTYPLNGRKYICESCATEIARLVVGFKDELTIASEYEDQARRYIANVKNQLGFLARTLTYEQVFGGSPVFEKKPKRKPAAASRSEDGSVGSQDKA